MQGALEVLRVEGGKALVEDQAGGSLEQGARQEEPAAFAVRELPAGLAYQLQQASGHAREEVRQAQGVAEDFLPFVNPNLSIFYPICTTGLQRIRLAS